MAPSYNLLSTAVYPILAKKVAMKIGSKYVFSEAEGRCRDRFSESAELSKAPAKRRILEMARALLDAARRLKANPAHRFGSQQIVEQIITLIEQRCALMLRRLEWLFH